jgi:hypothetical protein
MDFGDVLSRAWRIIWQHKVLWIFGILAGCGGANGGASGNFRTTFQGNELPPGVQRFFDQFATLPNWQIALIVGAIVLAALVLVVLAIFFGTIGRIGVIRGTYDVEQGVARLSFSDLFNDTLPFFWRVFGLNLLVGVAGFFVVIILAVIFIFFTAITLGIGLCFIIPLICLLVPLAWLVGVIVEQAIIAIVVENLGLSDGVRRGWEVFKNNFGSMVVMALILYVGVNLIVGFIIALPLALVISPIVLGAALGTNQALGRGLLTAAICFVLYLPVLIVLSGILRSYIESAWTLTYLRLTGEPFPPESVPVPG